MGTELILVSEEPKVESRGRHGGPRPGSGRKPNPAKLRMREVIERAAGDAHEAFKLIVEIAKDEATPIKIRLTACQEILDRCWGKAKSSIEVSRADDPGPLVDPETQRAMLMDPEICRLQAELDARLSLIRSGAKVEPADDDD